MAPWFVLGSADVKLKEAIKGCDSRSRTEKVRLRQKLEQRRAGAARGNPSEPMYKRLCRANDYTCAETVVNYIG